MKPWSSIAAKTQHSYQKLLIGLENCAESQQQQLTQLLKLNSDTHFGQYHHFKDIHNVDQFRNKIPLQSYDDLSPYIEEQLQGKSSLMAEPLLHVELTSGSSNCSNSSRLIPYTTSSLQAFQNAIHPWLHDIAQYYPRLDSSYFAISPAARSIQFTADGIAIGASSDALYLGEQLLQEISAISLVPEQLAALTDIRQWQYLTLAYWLRAENLSLISVWSPTFISTLLAALPAFSEQLIHDIHNGTNSTLAGVAPLSADPKRAAIVDKALSGNKVNTQLLWPDLQLISCWTHASAARFIPQLQTLFPHAKIQGKGLLSTEGVVSIPLTAYDYPVLAVNSGFYEFLDKTGNSYLAHELRADHQYEIVITVPGLYRYQTGDQVRIQGRAGIAPQLEFIGRSGLSCDLVGEKLTDAFVAGCLEGIEGFAMIAPTMEPQPHYCLYIEQIDNNKLLEKVEQALYRNPQYAYARTLGQLAPLRLIAVDHAWQKYQNWALNKGMRLSDIKPPSLRPEMDWTSLMQ